MKHFDSTVITYRYIFFFSALFCSVSIHAQSDTHSFLNISTGNADHETATESTTAKETENSCGNNRHCKHFYAFGHLDGGSANLYYTLPGSKRTTHGPTEAVSGQVAYKIRTNNEYRQLFVSAGAELRNLNNIHTFPKAQYGLVNDNLHLLYAGIPVMFQYINTRHTPEAKNDVNFYAQAGMSFDYRIYMYEHRKDHQKTWDDKEENFNSLLLQPFASVGISYTTRRNIFLLGPFLAYDVNDISSLSAVTGYFASYGIRLSALML